MKTLYSKVIVILVGSILYSRAFSQLCFNPPVIHAAGKDPYSICSADFNSDGEKDIAIANFQYGVNSVSVMLGAGAGNFTPATDFTVGLQPHAICSADFDGDGNADIATANYGSNNVTILLGSGTGSFGSATNFPAGILPVSICSADFNSDGIADLATANDCGGGPGNLSVLLGNGTGSFGATATYAVGTWPHSVITGDYNGDGLMDLVSGNFGSNDISLLSGTGTGSFGLQTNFNAGPVSGFNAGPRSVCKGDFNSDGYLDIATANDTMGTNIYVLYGTGMGSFSAPINYTVNITPWAIISADFNGDCNLDLATANLGSNNISILLGAGTGNFSAPFNFSGISLPKAIEVSDFNGDGKSDLAAVGDTGNVTLLLNCGGNDCFNDISANVNKGIYIAPNPVTNMLFIKNNSVLDYGNSSMSVENVFGQIIKSVPCERYLDVSNLPSGCYFLQLVTKAGQTHRTKFIKE